MYLSESREPKQTTPMAHRHLWKAGCTVDITVSCIYIMFQEWEQRQRNTQSVDKKPMIPPVVELVNDSESSAR